MRVTPKYCERCGIKISIEAIKRGMFTSIGEDYYCVNCEREMRTEGLLPKRKHGATTKGSPTTEISSPLAQGGKGRRLAGRKRRNLGASSSTSETSAVHIPQTGLGSQSVYLFLGLGAVGFLLFVFVILWAFSSAAPSKPATSAQTKKTKPSKAKTMAERFDQAFQKIISSSDSVDKKSLRLHELAKKFSSFLASPPGKERQKKLQETLNQYRYEVTIKAAQQATTTSGKLEVWKSALQNMKNTPYAERIQKKIQQLQKQWEKEAEQTFRKLLKKARAAANNDEYEEAIAILKKYPLEFHSTKWWKKEYPKWKKRFEHLSEFQNRMADVDLEAQQEMDNGNFQQAFKLYQKLLRDCPKHKEDWRREIQEWLANAKKREKEYLAQKAQEKKTQEELRRQQEKEQQQLAQLIERLKSGSWISLFDGKKFDGARLFHSQHQIQGGVLKLSSNPTDAQSPKILCLIPLRDYELKVELRVLKGYVGFVKVHKDGGYIIIRVGEKQPSRPVLTIPKGVWISVTFSLKEQTLKIQGSDTQTLPPRKYQVQHNEVGYVGLLVPVGGAVEIRSIRLRLPK